MPRRRKNKTNEDSPQLFQRPPPNLWPPPLVHPSRTQLNFNDYFRFIFCHRKCFNLKRRRENEVGHYGFSTLIALAIDSLSERISPRVLFPNTFLLTNWDNSIRFFTLLSSFLHGSFHFSFLNFLLECFKNVGWLVGCSWKHSCRPIESILINISGSSMWWLPEVSPTLRSHPRCSPFVKSG